MARKPTNYRYPTRKIARAYLRARYREQVALFPKLAQVGIDRYVRANLAHTRRIPKQEGR